MPGADDSKGHRGRLRDKLLKTGAAGLHDYELIEMALYGAYPRGDTKPLAKRLLKQFGSFNDAIAAEPARLKAVDGMGDAAVAALKLIEATAVRLAQGEVLGANVISSWTALLDYCHAAMARKSTEQFRILFLDNKNRLIADELQGRGTIDHTPVYPREVVKRALDLDASALIMVHNHPSGDPTPSKADIEMTREVGQAVNAVSIALHDHIVVSRTGHASFKSLGLL